jgi:hypothetical protein
LIIATNAEHGTAFLASVLPFTRQYAIAEEAVPHLAAAKRKEVNDMDKINPKEINTHPTFESLFPINSAVLEKIEQDMRDGKYDHSQPIILATWAGQSEPVCIDGHTRRQAAKNLGIEEVPVWLHEFDTEEEAIEKAIKLQSNRRNMTDAEILACVQVLDQRGRAGRPKKELAQGCANFSDGEAARDEQTNRDSCAAASTGKSAQAIGEMLGISTRKVEQARTVLDHADPETVEAVKNSETSINKASQETQKKRRKSKSGQSTKTAEEPATDHGPPQVDHVTESACAERGPVSKKHYEALSELGGSIEEHVASAIDLYLESRRAEYRGAPVETEQDNGDEDHSDPDDDEEYLDLDEYGDE